MVQRKFIVGSEWLYYKIYCGARTADSILLDYLKPALEELTTEKHIKQWFFIRYNDPDNHIRLRLQLKDTNKIGLVIQSLRLLFEPLLANRTIHKIQLDTYTRELERYGTTTISLAEELFCIDSRFILNALNLIADQELLLLIMLKNIDQLLASFELNLHEKRAFSRQQMQYYKQEFETTKTVHKQLAQKYRKQRLAITTFMNTQQSVYIPLDKLLKDKQLEESNLIQQLMAKRTAAGELATAQLASLIHMSVNRCFRTQQRLYELLMYDFLVRYYTSEIGKKQTKNA